MLPARLFSMNNELFVSLYDSLASKLAFDIQDTTAMRSVRIIPKALCQKRAPVILVEAVARGSAMYDGYYPLDEKRYREALPRYSVIRFNQSNLFNNNMDNRMKRLFIGGIDRRDGVCCMYGSMTLSAPADDTQDALERLFYFMDIFASCLGLKLLPVSLEWYRPEQSTNGGKKGHEKQ